MEGWALKEKGVSESQYLKNLSSCGGGKNNKQVCGARKGLAECIPKLLDHWGPLRGMGWVGDRVSLRPGHSPEGFSQIQKSSALHFLSFQPSLYNSTQSSSPWLLGSPCFQKLWTPSETWVPSPTQGSPPNPLVHGFWQQISKNQPEGSEFRGRIFKMWVQTPPPSISSGKVKIKIPGPVPRLRESESPPPPRHPTTGGCRTLRLNSLSQVMLFNPRVWAPLVWGASLFPTLPLPGHCCWEVTWEEGDCCPPIARTLHCGGQWGQSKQAYHFWYSKIAGISGGRGDIRRKICEGLPF